MTALGGTRRVGQLPTKHTPTEVASRVNHLLRGAFAQAVPLEATLVEGLNKIGHGLAVKVPHFLHAALPTTGVSVANAQAENPYPERQVWVRLAGVAELDVLIFLLPAVG